VRKLPAVLPAGVGLVGSVMDATRGEPESRNRTLGSSGVTETFLTDTTTVVVETGMLAEWTRTSNVPPTQSGVATERGPSACVEATLAGELKEKEVLGMMLMTRPAMMLVSVVEQRGSRPPLARQATTPLTPG